MWNVQQQLTRQIMSALCCGCLLVGCADPAADDDADNENSVEQTLSNLGIDTSVSPRIDSEGKPLPEDYTPLGASDALDKFDELVLLGWPLAASSGFNSQLTLLELDRASDASFSSDVLFAPDPAQTPWALSLGEQPDSLRQSVAADIDGDGLQELVVIYRAQPGQSIALTVYDDQPAGFVNTQSLTISTQSTHHINVVAADVNGDGFSEIIVAIVNGRSVQLQIIENTQGSLSLSSSLLTVEASLPVSDISVAMAAGQIDYDPSAEWALVINEAYNLSGESGVSQYYIFDDQTHDYEVLKSDWILAESLNRSAIVGDVALADIDGDNLDEIILGGLTHFDPNQNCNYATLVLALDDVQNDFSELGAIEKNTTIHNGCSAAAGKVRFVHVNAGDIDGDGVAEIQANAYIFDDFLNTPAFSPLLDANNDEAILPASLLYASNEGFSGLWSSTTSDISVADITANKRAEVIVISQSTGLMQVWGLGEPKPDAGFIDNEWRLIKDIPILQTDDQTPFHPVLQAINVNNDGLSIAFDAGEHKVVFTEPVLIAALAAAPCYTDLGQNLDACRTSYGTTESSTVDFEDSLTIKAGVMVGVNVEFSDPITALRISEVEASVKVTASASLSHSSSYTYSEEVEYTTGSVEDTVIFSTIPFDIYTYTITSHSDENLIGEKIVVSMPRSPTTLQVTRDFYNASVEHGGPLVDSTVFSHTAGQPDSYPSEADKDGLINQYDSIFPNQWAYAFGPTAIGEGGGSTSLAINIAEESGLGVGIGVEVEMEMKATFGVVMAGFTVGVGAESSLQIVHGEESRYTGSVANLPSAQFAGHYYQWGLMTYLKDDHPSGQQFEVINYWVE